MDMGGIVVALAGLKEGKLVSRKGGDFYFLQLVSRDGVRQLENVDEDGSHGEYRLSAEDVLAEDWEVVNE
jgi:hypothetical protein